MSIWAASRKPLLMSTLATVGEIAKLLTKSAASLSTSGSGLARAHRGLKDDIGVGLVVVVKIPNGRIWVLILICGTEALARESGQVEVFEHVDEILIP